MAEKDFVYFLVGGLVIIGVMLAVFSAGFGYGPTGSTLLGVGSPIFVGENVFDNVETLRASFTADNYLQTSVFDVGTRRVTNGLLFGSSEINTDAGNAEFVTVSFDVVNTNGYGPLVVRIDGQTVAEQNLAIGHYEYSFGSAKKIQIAARSSEWRIWAPAVYDLENVKISANVYPREISTYTFKLNDPEKIEEARIDFSLRENAGSLIVKLNGDVVYNGAVNQRQTIFIDKSVLDNLNIITFDAGEDSKFTGLATIALTKRTLQEKQLTAVVNLSRNEYAKFTSGTLAFDVVDVFAPGGYMVKITNGNRVLLNEFVKLEPGYFEFVLKKEHLQPGLNVIIVTSLDNAAFNIQGLMTRLS